MRFLVAALVALLPFTVGALDTPTPYDPFVIDGEIGPMLPSQLEQAIATAKGSNSDHIRLVINSPGGDVFSGMLAMDVLNSSGLVVICEVKDIAASMAAILLEGACSQRIAHEHSIIMFHEAKAGIQAYVTEGDAENLAAAIRSINKALGVRVAKRVGLTWDEYEKRAIHREWWLVGDEALTANVVDKVLPAPTPKEK